MTSCKEINVIKEKPKKTYFQVEIDIGDYEERRADMVDYLKNGNRPIGSNWMSELADIIDKG